MSGRLNRVEIKAKEYLGAYRESREAYEAARLALLEIETTLTHITTNYESLRVQSTPVNDRYADIIDRVITLRRAFIDAADTHARTMERVYRTIGNVDTPINRVILTRYYIAGQKWAEIAEDLGYSWSGIYKAFRRALTEYIEKNSEIFQKVN